MYIYTHIWLYMIMQCNDCFSIKYFKDTNTKNIAENTYNTKMQANNFLKKHYADHILCHQGSFVRGQ